MIQRRLWFILICNIAVETILRSSLVIKRIDKISLKVNVIQGVSCKKTQSVEEMNQCHSAFKSSTICPYVKEGQGNVKLTSALLLSKIR